jgi:hypothetical protein
LNLTDIASTRLASQQIAGTKYKSVKDIVSWMGVMQAQDYNMAKWAIGIRLPGSTQKTIEKAIDKGEIVRTHLLRPTWHFVSAGDIHWMLELTAPRIKASLKTRQKQLSLTPAILKKSNTVIEKALLKTGHATRDELSAEFRKAKINLDDSKASHLLLWAELSGLICSGATKGNKSTYALLNEWVPENKMISRDEALAKLAEKYFMSHCPATLQDFTWWSGLSITDAKHALESIKAGLVSEKTGTQTYWHPDSISISREKKKSVYLLPAFDEYIISYKDRTSILPLENHKQAISINGIFSPLIIIGGKVAGTWQRTIKNEKVIISTHFFKPPSDATKKLTEKAGEAFSGFLNRKAQIIHL